MPNLHPLIVHFPIALFLTAVICELAGYFLNSKVLTTVALVNSTLAAVAGIAAVITGLLASQIVPATGDVRTVMESHRTMGYLVLASASAFASLKFYAHYKQTDRYLITQIGIGLLGIVITLLAAHEGGQLVYRHRVGVQAVEKQKSIRSYPVLPSSSQPSDSTKDTAKTHP